MSNLLLALELKLVMETLPDASSLVRRELKPKSNSPAATIPPAIDVATKPKTSTWEVLAVTINKIAVIAWDIAVPSDSNVV
jgi:hypothetical protein